MIFLLLVSHIKNGVSREGEVENVLFGHESKKRENSCCFKDVDFVIQIVRH